MMFFGMYLCHVVVLMVGWDGWIAWNGMWVGAVDRIALVVGIFDWCRVL